MGDRPQWEIDADDIFAAAVAAQRPRRTAIEERAIAQVKRKHPGIDLKGISSLFTASKNPLPSLPPELQAKIMALVGYKGKALENIGETMGKLRGQKIEAMREGFAERNAMRAMLSRIEKAQHRERAEGAVAREQEAIAEWEANLRREAEERTAAVASAATRAREAARAKSRRRRGKPSKSGSRGHSSKTRRN